MSDVAAYEPPPSKPLGLGARLHCWWTIFRIALEERLAYRGDFALGTLMRFLPVITQIFLWWAIFESVSGGSDSGRMVGYSFHDMIAYYLLSMLGRAFSSMPGLASNVSKQIRDGEIKKYLIQPIDMIGFCGSRGQRIKWPTTPFPRCHLRLSSFCVADTSLKGGLIPTWSWRL